MSAARSDRCKLGPAQPSHEPRPGAILESTERHHFDMDERQEALEAHVQAFILLY